MYEVAELQSERIWNALELQTKEILEVY